MVHNLPCRRDTHIQPGDPIWRHDHTVSWEFNHYPACWQWHCKAICIQRSVQIRGKIALPCGGWMKDILQLSLCFWWLWSLESHFIYFAYCFLFPLPAEEGSSSTMSGGSGGFSYEVYGFCSPPIMSNTDPLLLATLSPPVSAPPTLQSVSSVEPAGSSVHPSVHQARPARAQTLPPSFPHTSFPVDESQGSPLGPVSPSNATRQIPEMTSPVSLAEEIPCCPLVMPLSLDVSGSQGGSPLTPLPLQDPDPAKEPMSVSYGSAARSERPQQPVVLHQPFSSMGGSKVSSLPQSPAPSQHGAGPGESDGEGRLGRGGFVDSTIKTLDEKLRNLLYQEYAPMYPSGSTAETPGSCTEYIQSPPGPDSATGGSGNSTPGPMGEGRYRAGEQLVSKIAFKTQLFYHMYNKKYFDRCIVSILYICWKYRHVLFCI